MIGALLRAMKRTAKALIPLGAALGVALTFTMLLSFMSPLEGISVLMLLLLGLLGAWAAANPRSFFMYWERGLLVMFELAEPPQFVIILTRLSGLIVLIACVIGIGAMIFN